MIKLLMTEKHCNLYIMNDGLKNVQLSGYGIFPAQPSQLAKKFIL